MTIRQHPTIPEAQFRGPKFSLGSSKVRNSLMEGQTSEMCPALMEVDYSSSTIIIIERKMMMYLLYMISNSSRCHFLLSTATLSKV